MKVVVLTRLVAALEEIDSGRARREGPMIKVDVHMHLYESEDIGRWWKTGYEIWEYGSKRSIEFSQSNGTVGEAVSALEAANFTHGVGLNLFALQLSKAQAIASLPADLNERERRRSIATISARMSDQLRHVNQWLCDALAGQPRLTPFVAVDPWVLTPQDNVKHLNDMAERGAAGIKIHPALQGFRPGDSRMLPMYSTCRDLGLAVLAHTGSSSPGLDQSAEPAAFAELLADFPDLNVVLAHLGGGSWRQTVQLADAFPQAAFDLCEIIEWAGATNAPSKEELARMIKDIGPERVMLGSDFPWYDPGRTEDLVMQLPALSDEEKENILGRNAVRILGLAV